MANLNIDQKILSKLSAEGLTIHSDWVAIEKCLKRTVAPNQCLAAARRMREKPGVGSRVEWSHMGRYKENAGYRRFYRGIIEIITPNNVAIIKVLQRRNFNDIWVDSLGYKIMVAITRLKTWE